VYNIIILKIRLKNNSTNWIFQSVKTYITAEACGVSTSNVSRIFREAKILKAVSCCVRVTRKGTSIPKRATNVDEFEKDVRRIMLEFYDSGEFPTVKKITLSLRENVHIRAQLLVHF
jgi:hypothetical protein